MTMYRLNSVPANVRALPIIQSASGAVVTFDTDLVGENLIDVECEIVYSQAEGTPSPSNPLPILTFEDLTLYHNPINLWNEQWELGGIDATTGQNTSSTTTIRTKGYIAVSPNEQLYLVTSKIIRFRWYDENRVCFGNQQYNASGNVTIPNGCYYCRFVVVDETTYQNNISLNSPNTETAYQPFNGVYVSFGQTVAKGTLNVITGVLRVTHGFDSFDLSQISYTNSNGIDSWALTASQSSTGGSDSIDKKCNINGVYSYSTTRYEHFYVANTGIRVWFTENTARDKIAQFVYPLETPYDIQLSATQITALLNQNHIWCDTGDTSLKYWVTIDKYIGA